MDLTDLIKKYSAPGPRYTSYPTAPQWLESLGAEAYRNQLESGTIKSQDPVSLYVHIPFCEALCYYCGCNIQITKDHGRSAPYMRSLLREAECVADLMGERQTLSQMAWGGGTPTFLKPNEIEQLFRGIEKVFDIAPDAEIGIEVDPRVTSGEQLACLRSLGFTRLSMGVQDFDENVQKAINRVQSAEMTENLLSNARKLGFEGLNFDLIYGLPHQSLASFEKTIDKVISIRPDRIALYNYARLPTLLKHQGILEEYPMPKANERVEIFTMAYARLSAAGYQSIGMDHFALAEDELSRAMSQGTLYRNFQGYSVKLGKHMIGIGASSIGNVGESYFQNIRRPQEYEKAISESGIATFRGCLLSPDDIRRKWVIQQIMCRFQLGFDVFEKEFGDRFEQYFALELPELSSFFSERILERYEGGIRVTSLGRLFVRNVAMVFDAYLKGPQKATYSKTV